MGRQRAGPLALRAARLHIQACSFRLCKLVDMRLLVNGEPLAAREGETVAGLVGRLGLDVRKLAVERNRAIVPKSAYAQTTLVDDDVIEIVHFVGGG